LVADGAQKALDSDSPGKALTMAEEALKLDPQFQRALKIKEEAAEKLNEKIANLMNIAQELIDQGRYKELQKQANDILAQDPQNKEATRLLHEATAQLLYRDKERNLRMAKKFYEQGIYESAKARAEKVLKVDPTSIEAKQLVEKSDAEMQKPKLRLRGFTTIKGMKIAHLEMPQKRERKLVMEGETFGPFKVSAIDLDLKAVVVTYSKTGSQQTLTLREE
jgi:tetratricopeptide (TPR) repeat protein